MTRRTRFAGYKMSFAVFQRDKAVAVALIARSVGLDDLEFETSALGAMVAHDSASAVACGTRDRPRASQHTGAAAGFASRHDRPGTFDGIVLVHAAHFTAHEKGRCLEQFS